MEVHKGPGMPHGPTGTHKGLAHKCPCGAHNGPAAHKGPGESTRGAQKGQAHKGPAHKGLANTPGHAGPGH